MLGLIVGIIILVGVILLIYWWCICGLVFMVIIVNDKVMYFVLVVVIVVGLGVMVLGFGVVGEVYNYCEMVLVWFCLVWVL